MNYTLEVKNKSYLTELRDLTPFIIKDNTYHYKEFQIIALTEKFDDKIKLKNTNLKNVICVFSKVGIVDGQFPVATKIEVHFCDNEETFLKKLQGKDYDHVLFFPVLEPTYHNMLNDLTDYFEKNK